MIWCVRAALVLAIVVFVPGLRESFEPPKAAVVRACGLGLLAAAALAWRERRCAVDRDRWIQPAERRQAEQEFERLDTGHP